MLVLLALVEISLHDILTCIYSVTLTFFNQVIFALPVQEAPTNITTDMAIAVREGSGKPLGHSQLFSIGHNWVSAF